MDIHALALACLALSLAGWLYLLLGHGGFWLSDQRLAGSCPAPEPWPAIAVVLPARNEADVIPETLGSVLAQDYPGPMRVVLVDDESDDGTGAVALETASRSPRPTRFQLRATEPRPPGWVGKMWAVETGVRAATDGGFSPKYLWVTDADVAHLPDTLRRLVAQAESRRLDLVSLMVRLHCGRGLDRLLVPAFVYFFQQLYPFRRVNDPAARTAGAAGGCMLVNRAALERSGGIEPIRGELIDDCALARRIKAHGPIWLGLAEGERSLRSYPRLGHIWDMVARSAYAQLRHSPAWLFATLLALLFLYALPPLGVVTWPLHGAGVVALLGACAWLAMALSFLPTLRLYRRSPALAPVLPLAAMLYACMTVASANRHRRGRGGQWKGRVEAGREAGGAIRP